MHVLSADAALNLRLPRDGKALQWGPKEVGSDGEGHEVPVLDLDELLGVDRWPVDSAQTSTLLHGEETLVALAAASLAAEVADGRGGHHVIVATTERPPPRLHKMHGGAGADRESINVRTSLRLLEPLADTEKWTGWKPSSDLRLFEVLQQHGSAFVKLEEPDKVILGPDRWSLNLENDPGVRKNVPWTWKTGPRASTCQNVLIC